MKRIKELKLQKLSKENLKKIKGGILQVGCTCSCACGKDDAAAASIGKGAACSDTGCN